MGNAAKRDSRGWLMVCLFVDIQRKFWAVVGSAVFTLVFGNVAAGSESPPPAGPWSFEATYKADLLRNTHGGLAVGNAYLDNVDLTLDFDADIGLNIPGLKIHTYLLYNNAARFSAVYPGDAMTASNIDAPRAIRLYEAWADWNFGGTSKTSLLVGLYDVNSEFDVTDSRRLFLNSTFGVGHELGQTGRNGPSIFPVTSLAVRLATEHSPGWSSLVAVIDGVPGDPDDPSATRIHLSKKDGALVMAEVAHTSERIGKIAVGAWHYTAQFEQIDANVLHSNTPQLSTNSGGYALIDSTLWRDTNRQSRRVEAFFRIGVSSDAVNEYDASAQLGLVLHQPFVADVEESFGFGMAAARAGARFRRAQAAIGIASNDAEAMLEVTYRRSINAWLTLQPDLQYIKNPSADRSISDALVIGLRFEVTL